jgi:hypothetical protein
MKWKLKDNSIKKGYIYIRISIQIHIHIHTQINKTIVTTYLQYAMGVH